MIVEPLSVVFSLREKKPLAERKAYTVPLPICENNPSIRLPRHYEKPAAPDSASEYPP
jgi:hypothetical protein